MLLRRRWRRRTVHARATLGSLVAITALGWSFGARNAVNPLRMICFETLLALDLNSDFDYQKPLLNSDRSGKSNISCSSKPLTD